MSWFGNKKQSNPEDSRSSRKTLAELIELWPYAVPTDVESAVKVVDQYVPNRSEQEIVGIAMLYERLRIERDRYDEEVEMLLKIQEGMTHATHELIAWIGQHLSSVSDADRQKISDTVDLVNMEQTMLRKEYSDRLQAWIEEDEERVRLAEEGVRQALNKALGKALGKPEEDIQVVSLFGTDATPMTDPSGDPESELGPEVSAEEIKDLLNEIFGKMGRDVSDVKIEDSEESDGKPE